MQCMNSLSPTLLKRHLFYLIDYDFIFYNRQKNACMIKDRGLELLSRIIENKMVRICASRNYFVCSLSTIHMIRL